MIEPWTVSNRCRWYNFKSSIRLYHGTSSVFLDQILEQGLVPPEGDIEERVWKAVLKCGVDYNIQLRRKLQREASYLWCWNHVKCICLTTNPFNAASYAEHTHRNGGELNGLVKCHLGEILKKKFPVHYPESKPVVVEVLVPISWLPEEKVEHIRRDTHFWLMESETGKSHSHEEMIAKFDEGAGRFKHEIRLQRRIPKSRIARVMAHGNR